LTVTGKLDSDTVRVLASDTSPAATRTVPSVASAMDIRSAQRELKDRGYYSGPVDDVLGAATEAALRAYQRDRGPKVTGRLDSPTVRSLTS
jgi:peptidoglycan hydrolase-like protein with peptidoglycan-binding domain